MNTTTITVAIGCLFGLWGIVSAVRLTLFSHYALEWVEGVYQIGLRQILEEGKTSLNEAHFAAVSYTLADVYFNLTVWTRKGLTKDRKRAEEVIEVLAKLTPLEGDEKCR